MSFGEDAEELEGTREDVRVNVGETEKSFDAVVSELETSECGGNTVQTCYTKQ